MLFMLNFLPEVFAPVWVLGVLIELLIPGSLSCHFRASHVVGCTCSQLHDVFLRDRLIV